MLDITAEYMKTMGLRQKHVKARKWLLLKQGELKYPDSGRKGERLSNFLGLKTSVTYLDLCKLPDPTFLPMHPR